MTLEFLQSRATLNNLEGALHTCFHDTVIPAIPSSTHARDCLKLFELGCGHTSSSTASAPLGLYGEIEPIDWDLRSQNLSDDRVRLLP
jgi:hypothetical protein